MSDLEVAEQSGLRSRSGTEEQAIFLLVVRSQAFSQIGEEHG